MVKAIAEYILAQPLVQSDETPIRMQLADGQMETARLWAYGSPWAEVVFDFRTDKSQQGPMQFLTGTVAGYVQSDGGSSYTPVYRALSLKHIACMAHIRRALFEARDEAPLGVDLILAAMQNLYRIECQAKERQSLRLQLPRRLQLHIGQGQAGDGLVPQLHRSTNSHGLGDRGQRVEPPAGLPAQAIVLKNGGCIVILDTTRPKRNILSPFIWLHMHFVIPTLGGLLTGSRDAYRYLPETTEGFVTAEDMAGRMAKARFQKVGFQRYMFGTIAIHWGEK